MTIISFHQVKEVKMSEPDTSTGLVSASIDITDVNGDKVHLIINYEKGVKHE